MPGAYGFELLGAAGAAAQLVETPPDWPRLTIERVVAVSEPRRSVIGSQHADIELVAGGRLALLRSPLRATFTTARALSDDALVHPYLAPAAAIAAYWQQREAFHAGGFLLDRSVWAVLGEKGSGKSSLLALLAGQGHGVVADDALIVERDGVFAGPRSIDLRQESAVELRIGKPIGVVGDRERWRLGLGQVPSTSSLRGWIFLSWADAVDVRPVAAGERLQRLLRARMIKGLPPPQPSRMLELAALPGFELNRPRSWSQLQAAGSRLVDRLCAA